MSLSRSPSPQPGGGWSTPGLTEPSAPNLPWAPAKLQRSLFSTAGKMGLRNWKSSGATSSSVPTYSGMSKITSAARSRADELTWSDVHAFLRRLALRLKNRVVLVLVAITLYTLFYVTPAHQYWRGNSFLGGGNKFVLILASNHGGGVMEWKGPRDWAIERDSIRNKRNYAEMWGYSLEVADMATKKRYAHEWRESWEKVDTIRNVMRKYPNAEWFWWMDLHTYVMEPTYSLQSHIFNQLERVTYRDINEYNPLNITHPPTGEWLDKIDKSPVGDGLPSSINMIIPQDCSGFNLGSFFIRRSAWADRLLDIWWDPVGYEQKHMEWEHREQDALEHIYTNHPWVRSHVAFIPQRKINSFPVGACSEHGENPLFHYNQRDRDFFVNMAGCQWGRDCWSELYEFRRISQMLNRNLFVKAKDWVMQIGKGRRKNRGGDKNKKKHS